MESTIVFVKNLSSGGAEKQAVLLALALSAEYDSHIVLWQGGAIADRYAEMLGDSSVQVHHIYGGAPARFRGLVSLLRAIRPVAVLSSLTAANVIAALAGRIAGVKVVTSLRSTHLPAVKLIADRLACNRLAAATVSNSHAGLKVFGRRGFRADRLCVIPNCFEDIKPYCPRDSRPEHDDVRVISVGRFVPDKDYPTALRAFARAAAADARLRYDIVGYGPLEGEIHSLVDELSLNDLVDIHINPSNIPALLDRADIYLSSSTVEGTSNAILEALNADLPAVATDTGDNARLVIDGISGRVVAVGDTDAIADALTELAADTRKRRAMGAAAKRHLAENFSQTSFFNNYKSLLQRIK